MVTVEAPSRLHLGLLHPPWGARRRFGGVGLMIDRPGVRVTVEAAAHWSAEGPSSQRALGFARRAAEALRLRHPLCVRVERCPPEHVGFGTGTQLALCVGRAVAGLIDPPRPSYNELARLFGRGKRSAVGVHGFEHGGLIVELGKRADSEISPMLGSYPCPPAWRVVTLTPERAASPYSGTMEERAFARLVERADTGGRPDDGVLCEIVLGGVIPSLLEGDFPVFSEAVYEFNRRSGELFAPVQGGVYSSAEVGELVTACRNAGAPGAGQSSWGPTVFALTGGQEEAESLLGRLGSCGQIEKYRCEVASVSPGAVASGG